MAPAALIDCFGLPGLVRDALASLLRERQVPTDVVGLDLGAARLPRLVLWDPAATDPSADAALRRLVSSGAHVLLLTGRPTPDLVARGAAVGAAGILPPGARGDGFVDTVCQVLRRRTLGEARPPTAVDELTPREADVLERICAGMRNSDIAEELHLSVNSVKTYVRLAYRKIGVERRSEAVIWGAQHGLVARAPAARPA